MNQQVTEYIENAPPEQKEIMERVRSIIHENIEDVVENYKWSRPIFSLNHDFAYLKNAKKHVTLGFFSFEKINDKYNQLEGTGKDMRHIKLKTMDDVDPALLKEWFTAVSSK